MTSAQISENPLDEQALSRLIIALLEADDQSFTHCGRITADGRSVREWAAGDFEKVTGHPAVEDFSQYMEFVHPADRPLIQEHSRRLREKGRSTVEFHGYTPDHQLRWMRSRAIAFPLGGGEFRVVSTVTDITPQMQTEKQLRDQANLLDLISDAIVVLDMDQTIIGWNAAAERIYGWTAEEVVGKESIALLQTQYIGTSPAEVMHRFLETGHARAEVIQRRKDGSPVFIAASSTLIRAETGEPMAMVGINQDITAQRIGQTRLVTTEDRYPRLEETALEGGWLLDANHITLSISPLIADWLGYTVDDLIGQPLPCFVDPADRPLVEAHLGHPQQGMSELYEARFRRKDGSVMWSMVRSSPILDSGGQYSGALKMITDITRRKQAEESLHQRAEELISLLDASHAFLQPEDMIGRLEQICRVAVERFRLKLAWIGLLQGNERILRPNSAFGEAVDYAKNIVIRVDDPDEGRGPTGRVIRTGHPFTFNDLEHDPDFHPWRDKALRYGLRASLAVPLMLDGRTLGVLNLYSGEAGYFTPQRIQTFHLLGNLAAIALDNARKLEEATTSRERIQRLSRQLISAQEAERRRIAHDLHDEAGQALTGLKFGLELLRADIPVEQIIIRKKLGELAELAGSTMELIRQVAHNLRPPVLDKMGLHAALEAYTREWERRTGIQSHYTGQDIAGLPDEIGTSLYRFAQEALTNIVKHAQATKAFVTLQREGREVTLTIADNGRGFSPDALQKEIPGSGGLGLIGVQERLALVGGRLEIGSKPDEGATLIARVPVGSVHGAVS